MAMVSDLLPRLASPEARDGVTVAARTELTLTRTSLNCSLFSQASRSPN